MILYIENLKDTTGKLLKLINKFSNVAGYKVMYGNLLYFYIQVTKYQKEEIRKQSHLHQKE